MKKIFLKIMAIIILATGFSKDAKAISNDGMYALIGGSGLFTIISAIIIYKNKSRILETINEVGSLRKRAIDNSKLNSKNRKEAQAALDKLNTMLKNLLEAYGSADMNDSEVNKLITENITTISDFFNKTPNEIVILLRQNEQYKNLGEADKNKLDEHLNFSALILNQIEQQKDLRSQIEFQQRQVTRLAKDAKSINPLGGLYNPDAGALRMEASALLTSKQNELGQMINQHNTELQLAPHPSLVFTNEFLNQQEHFNMPIIRE